MSRTSKSARNAFFGTIKVLIIDNIFPFILRTVLLRVLGEKYLGLNNLFHSILSLLSFAEAGFDSAITFSMYKPLAENDDQKVCRLLSLYKKIYITIGLFVLMCGISCVPFLDKLIKNGYPADVNIYYIYLIYLSETVCRFMFFAYKEALLNAKQMASTNHKLSIIVDVIIFFLRLNAIVIFKNYNLFIFLLPVAVILRRLVISLYVTKRFPQYLCNASLEKNESDAIVDLCKDITMHKIGETVSSSLGNVVISANIGLTAVAIYGNYTYIYSALSGVANTIVGSATASIGDLIAVENEKQKNISTFNRVNMVNMWINSWTSSCLFCLYRDFMLMWVKENLTADIFTSLAFTALYYIENCRKTINVYKSSAGIWKPDKYKSLVGGAINILITLIFVKRIGYVGATLSLVIVNMLIYLPWECKVLISDYFDISLKDFYKEIMSNCLVTVLSIVVSFAVCMNIHGLSVVTFILKGIIAFMISNAIYYIVYRKNEIFIETYSQIKSVILSGIRKISR